MENIEGDQSPPMRLMLLESVRLKVVFRVQFKSEVNNFYILLLIYNLHVVTYLQLLYLSHFDTATTSLDNHHGPNYPPLVRLAPIF